MSLCPVHSKFGCCPANNYLNRQLLATPRASPPVINYRPSFPPPAYPAGSRGTPLKPNAAVEGEGSKKEVKKIEDAKKENTILKILKWVGIALIIVGFIALFFQDPLVNAVGQGFLGVGIAGLLFSYVFDFRQ